MYKIATGIGTKPRMMAAKDSFRRSPALCGTDCNEPEDDGEKGRQPTQEDPYERDERKGRAHNARHEPRDRQSVAGLSRCELHIDLLSWGLVVIGHPASISDSTFSRHPQPGAVAHSPGEMSLRIRIEDSRHAISNDGGVWFCH